MKIGILSYHNSVNYGAVLQIYALKKSMEKYGANVSVIDYRSINTEFGDVLLSETIKEIGLTRAVAKYVYYHIFAKKAINNKSKKFINFINNNFNLTKHYKSKDEFVANNDFDIIICGSDQIWNPEITKGFDDMMFCNFGTKKIRKYSYAASVGDVKIIDTGERQKEFFELINNFDGISVREQDLADYISYGSDINPIVTLDPALLLDAEEYFISNEMELHDKYILIYQITRYSRSMQVAKQLAKEKNLKIIEIMINPYVLKKNSLMRFCDSPSEFLNLIKNAEYVITNSFHGTVFSIIFKKNFYTVASRVRNSRITNLLNTFNLSDRLINENDDYFTRETIDYTKIEPLIKKEREKSLNFLKSIIERKESDSVK